MDPHAINIYRRLSIFKDRLHCDSWAPKFREHFQIKQKNCKMDHCINIYRRLNIFTFLYNEGSTFSSSHMYNTLLDITYLQPTIIYGIRYLHTLYSIHVDRLILHNKSQSKIMLKRNESVFWATRQFKCKSKRKVDESSTGSHVLRNHHHLKSDEVKDLEEGQLY